MITRLVSLAAILLFYTNCGTGSTCEQQISSYYLDSAVDFINKAKSNFPSPITCEGDASRNALDCSELLEKGHKKSGVYTVWPKSRVIQDEPVSVYCDMETDGGGWTLIQRRGPFGREVDYFYKDWKSYKEGFGDIEKDFWLGNDNIYALTNQKLYSVRFDLEDVENDTRYAHYDTFWIDGEDSKYTLHIANYTGEAGDSMIFYHNNNKFSVSDQDNDNSTDRHCAQNYKGGWWYSDCLSSNPNGRYLNGKYESPVANGVIWNTWKGLKESLQSTEIKIRPKTFSLPRVSLDNTPK